MLHLAAAEVRHGRPDEPLHRAARGRGGLRPADGGETRRGRGQLTLQYHAGGGVLPGEIGALFGRQEALSEADPRGDVGGQAALPRHDGPLPGSAAAAVPLYFAEGCPPVPLDSDEGQRLMLANAAAMNYGFAFRIANYAALRQIAADVFGGTPGQLVVDSPHNSIYEEEVDGEPAVVHRHNSCRAYPAELMPAGHDLRRDRPGPAGSRDPPDLVLPVRGGRSARRALLRLPRRGHRRLRLRQAGHLRGGRPAAQHAAVPLQRRGSGRATQLDDKGIDEVLGVLVRAASSARWPGCARSQCCTRETMTAPWASPGQRGGCWHLREP